MLIRFKSKHTLRLLPIVAETENGVDDSCCSRGSNVYKDVSFHEKRIPIFFYYLTPDIH